MPYEELTRWLQAWAAARPELVEMESLGKSPEGRDLWFLTITNRATGPASAKPALLVDGNMHAVEWSGGVAALNFTWKLLRDYGRDADVTRLLDTRTVYVLPRMTPDGVEATLRGGKIIRSAIRPGKEEAPAAGLRMQDLDGDGQIVFMRYRDPNGAWKQDPRDPRLMVPRGPREAGGETWRVVPEGMIEGDFNGETFEVLNALDGIDFGVFFPDPRDPVPQGAVTDPDPVRVPEVAAYVKAIRERPNIFAHVTCHNFGGLLLTPPVNPDDKMPARDRYFYRAMGEKIRASMGYLPMSYL
ncbi:MAG TPA: M14 family metallopeptidase, partial [Pseudomonadales bacterium]|nr:M14 family metallopeptidase [Pseudomonadales bacterium]